MFARLALLLALLSLSGCSHEAAENPGVSATRTSQVTATSIDADCLLVTPLVSEWSNWARITNEINAEFPFRGDLKFKEKVHTYRYGRGLLHW
jgi:hypothetical protein